MTAKERKRLREVWRAMLQRCNAVNSRFYHNYGGRNIGVCERWHDFETFLSDMGRRPRGFTLERKNNDGNYEPANCCWANRKTQQRNRRCSVFLTVRGKRRHLYDWAKLTGSNPVTLAGRIRRGIPHEKAIVPYDVDKWKNQRATWADELKPKIIAFASQAVEGIFPLSHWDVGKMTGWRSARRQRIAIRTLIQQGFMKVIFKGSKGGSRLAGVYQLTMSQSA